MIKAIKLTEFEEDVFEFLDELRENGVTNMFGAGSYITDEFLERHNTGEQKNE